MAYNRGRAGQLQWPCYLDQTSPWLVLRLSLRWPAVCWLRLSHGTVSIYIMPCPQKPRLKKFSCGFCLLPIHIERAETRRLRYQRCSNAQRNPTDICGMAVGRGPGSTGCRPVYRRSVLNTRGLGAPRPPTASTSGLRTITAVTRSVSTCLADHENEPNTRMLQSWLGALAVD